MLCCEVQCAFVSRNPGTFVLQKLWKGGPISGDDDGSDGGGDDGDDHDHEDQWSHR